MRTGTWALLRGSPIAIAATLALPGEATAFWGENWGEMLWGGSAPTPVPTLGLIQLLGLALAVAALGVWRLRRKRTGLGLTLLLVALPLTVRAGMLATPQTFVNGTVADAD